MKGITVFKNVSDARYEGFEVYDPTYTDYIIVCKATKSGRAFAIALRGAAPIGYRPDRLTVSGDTCQDCRGNLSRSPT